MPFNISGTINKIFFISSHALLSMLVLLQSLSLQVSVPETVLCIGDDGHIMLEREGIDIHCQLPTEADILTETANNDFHEDNCVDIPLKNHLENAELIKTTNLKTNISPRNNHFMVNRLNSQTLETNKSFLDYFASFASHTSYKSVVLLI